MNRARALLAAALTTVLAMVLGLAAVAVATPAQAARVDAQGTLSVKILDERGRPTTGVLYVVGADGFADQLLKVSNLEAPLDPGSYGVLAFTPWGGMQCAALSPCSTVQVELGHVVPDGSLVVTSAKTTSVTFRATPPAKIAGPPRSGRVVRLVWSRPMVPVVKRLQALGPRVQWLRSGKVVRGATGTRYVVSAADVGKKLTARMTYPAAAVQQLEQLVGPFPTTRTTAPVKVRG